MRPNCGVCGKPATKIVHFSAYEIGHKHQVTGTFNLFLCDSHAKTTEPKDLFSVSGWESVQRTLLSCGKALLDRNTLKLSMKAIP